MVFARALLLGVVGLGVVGLAVGLDVDVAFGQAGQNPQTIPNRGPAWEEPMGALQGVFVTPVPGAPFTATVVIETKHVRQDGSTGTLTSQALIARDAKGRIRNERHALVPDGFKGNPPLLGIHLFDPATRVSTMLNPQTQVAHQMVIPLPQRPAAQQNETKEDLGMATLNGLEAKGTRLSRTGYMVQKDGTRTPFTFTREFWYSDALQMNILERFNNGRGGEQSLAVLSVQREEPSEALFEVPAGYSVMDVTPVATSAH